MLLETWVLVASEVVSAGLALFIVYSMFRVYGTTRSEYLLGFPIGFSFLALGYIVFGVSYAAPGLEELASWVHLTLTSYGFAFIAGTYFLKRRSLWRPVRRAAVWLFSMLIVLLVIILATILVPLPMALPPYRTVHVLFRTANLVLLAYVLYSLYQALRGERLEVGVMVMSGFLFLAGNEYSLLLWALDRGFASDVFAHVLRLAGLVTLSVALSKRFRKR